MTDRITVNGEPVDRGDMMADTYVVMVQGAYRLVVDGQLSDHPLRQLRGGLFREADGTLWAPNSTMAMLTSDDGEDLAALGVEPR